MISSTANFNTEVNKTSRSFRGKISVNGSVVDCVVNLAKIYKGACGDSFTIGSLYASYIEADLLECKKKLFGDEIVLSIGILLPDSSVEYVSLGKYKVKAERETEGRTRIEAVGTISQKFDSVYTSSLEFPTSIQNVVSELEEQTGSTILIDSAVSANGTIEKRPNGMQCKAVLSLIVGLLGCYATEDVNGNVVVKKCVIPTNKISVNGDKYTQSPEFDSSVYELTGVKVVVSEVSEDENGNAIAEVSYSYGEPNMILSNAYMTESLFEDFKSNVSGYRYSPGTVTLALGDPRIEPWDCLEVTDIKGNVYTVPCLNIVHTFDGGFTTQVISSKDANKSDGGSVKGPLTQQLESIAYDLIVAKEAILNRVKTDELEAKVAEIGYIKADEIDAKLGDFGYLKADELEAEIAEIGYIKTSELDAKVAELGYITADSVDVKYANIDFANITEASIENFYAKSGVIEDMVISDGHVTGTLVGVTIKGDLIEGGTITADKLIIKGEDGLYYQLNTDGETISSQQTDYNSLNGSIITAKSVTAEKINVDELTAFASTIAGIHIKDGKFYSSTKNSVYATTEGFYLDKNGQFALGDAEKCIMWYRDSNGEYKLLIMTDDIVIGSDGMLLTDAIEEAKAAAEGMVVGTRNYIRNSRTMVYEDYVVVPLSGTVAYVGSAVVGTSTIDGVVITANRLNRIETDIATADMNVQSVRETMGV